MRRLGPDKKPEGKSQVVQITGPENGDMKLGRIAENCCLARAVMGKRSADGPFKFTAPTGNVISFEIEERYDDWEQVPDDLLPTGMRPQPMARAQAFA